MLIVALIALGIVVGVVCDTENWPIDNWLVVELIYVTVAYMILGTIEDIRHWRRER